MQSVHTNHECHESQRVARVNQFPERSLCPPHVSPSMVLLMAKTSEEMMISKFFSLDQLLRGRTLPPSNGRGREFPLRKLSFIILTSGGAFELIFSVKGVPGTEWRCR